MDVRWNVVGRYVYPEAAVGRVAAVVGHDRPVAGITDGQHHRLIAPVHVNRLVDDIHVDPLAVDFVLIRVGRVDALDIHVLHIRADVGHAPGDAVIVADDDAGNARKGESTHVIGATVGFLDAVQANLVPDGGHLDAQVRIVG